MNSFTKEELLGLLYMVITFINECEGGNKAYEMKHKIQTMIDNYCEHSESEVDYDYEVELCEKCRRLFL